MEFAIQTADGAGTVWMDLIFEVWEILGAREFQSGLDMDDRTWKNGATIRTERPWL